MCPMLISYYSMTSGSNVFINEGIFEQLISAIIKN